MNGMRVGVGLVAAFCMLVGACSSSGGGGPAPSAGDSGAAAPTDVTIHIAENDWLSAKINDQIAKIILTEQMGMKADLIPATTSDQWDRVGSGELHVSLEVWPSGHPQEMANDLGTKVEDGGALGPIAKAGWFIPTYLLNTYPKLATWQGFTDPQIVSMFQAPGSGNKGRFLGGDPKWVQYDQEIIDNLGLPFTVIFSGSEDATLKELDADYSVRKPLLFYLWTPHWALAKYDLTMVQLPANTDECWAKAATNGINCDYPADHLFKMLWPGLKNLSPKAYAFLKNMNYTTKDQVDMMADVELHQKTEEQAARDWMDAHQDAWKAWIPQ
jgi:glycine betaine/proline transport system substrate-binding protein